MYAQLFSTSEEGNVIPEGEVIAIDPQLENLLMLPKWIAEEGNSEDGWFWNYTPISPKEMALLGCNTLVDFNKF